MDGTAHRTGDAFLEMLRQYAGLSRVEPRRGLVVPAEEILLPLHRLIEGALRLAEFLDGLRMDLQSGLQFCELADARIRFGLHRHQPLDLGSGLLVLGEILPSKDDPAGELLSSDGDGFGFNLQVLLLHPKRLKDIRQLSDPAVRLPSGGEDGYPLGEVLHPWAGFHRFLESGFGLRERCLHLVGLLRDLLEPPVRLDLPVLKCFHVAYRSLQRPDGLVDRFEQRSISVHGLLLLQEPAVDLLLRFQLGYPVIEASGLREVLVELRLPRLQLRGPGTDVGDPRGVQTHLLGEQVGDLLGIGDGALLAVVIGMIRAVLRDVCGAHRLQQPVLRLVVIVAEVLGHLRQPVLEPADVICGEDPPEDLVPLLGVAGQELPELPLGEHGDLLPLVELDP